MSEYLDSKPFVVAWINFFDNKLHQEEVQALHRMHALTESRQNIITLDDTHRVPQWKKLQELAFNRDGMFSVIEVK